MSLSPAITVIVLADLAVIGLVTFVMSRARLLRAHVSTAETAIETPTAATRRVVRPITRPRPAGARPQPTPRGRLIQVGRPPS
jgi:hypothetical protein